MTRSPRVSVVIPTYNNAKYLLSTVNSALAQTIDDLEVIVVDDGSTDNTRELLDSFNARVRYVYQENQGAPVARNRGIDEARGELIAFLDSDDLWLPQNLAVKVAVLDAERDVGSILSDFCIFQEDRILHEIGSRALYPIYRRDEIGVDDIFGPGKQLEGPSGPIRFHAAPVFDRLFRGNFVLTSTLVVRRDILVDAGRFNPQFKTNEDYDLFLRIARFGQMAYVDDPLVRYRRHPNQLTSPENNVQILETVLRIIEQFEADFCERGKLDDFIDRKAQVLTSLGTVCIGAGRVADARHHLRRSIVLRPARLTNYVHCLMSMMPVRQLQKLRRRH